MADYSVREGRLRSDCERHGWRPMKSRRSEKGSRQLYDSRTAHRDCAGGWKSARVLYDARRGQGLFGGAAQANATVIPDIDIHRAAWVMIRR